MFHKLVAGLSIIAMTLTLGLGITAAQDSTPVPAMTLTAIPVDGTLIVYTGTLTITAPGELFIGQYKIAPAGAFIPTILESGKTVTIVGRLLPDNITIQAFVLEIEVVTVPPAMPTMTFTPAMPTLTPTPGGIFVTFTPTPGGPTATFTPVGLTATFTPVAPTMTPTALVSSDDLGKGGFYCRNIDTARHPVGERIANEFGVPYADVMYAFCVQRLGFGEITRIYRVAQDTGVDPAPIIVDRANGIDWTVIILTYNINITLIDTNDLFGVIPGTTVIVERGQPIVIIDVNNGNDGNNGNSDCQGNNGNGNGKGKCKDKDKDKGNNGKGKNK